MSNFQQYTGSPITIPALFPGVVIHSGDIADFGTTPVPQVWYGTWATNAGPATIGTAVVVAPNPQLPVVAHVYNSGTGAPTTGSYTVGQTAVDSTGAVFVCTGSGTPGAWVSSSGGATGQTLSDPVKMADVAWCFANYDVGPDIIQGVYVNGTAGVGATLTASANGVLAVDSGAPTVGQRILVADPYNNVGIDGIYTVTSVGSAGTKWVLTRATDMNMSATLGQYWLVRITGGTLYGGGSARVMTLGDVAGAAAFTIGTSHMGLAISSKSSVALGAWSTAVGSASTAMGGQSVVTGHDANGPGDTAYVTGAHSFGGGTYNTVAGASASALGADGFIADYAKYGATIGEQAVAYSPNQFSHGGGGQNRTGDTQYSRVVMGGKTTNATPTVLTVPGNPFYLLNKNAVTDYKQTALFRCRVVARRYDTPGTDSAWTFQGVIRGNGSSAFSWVGGSAPTATVVAQDAGASAWGAAVAFSAGGQLSVTVTGAAGATIIWESSVELDEAAG